ATPPARPQRRQGLARHLRRLGHRRVDVGRERGTGLDRGHPGERRRRRHLDRHGRHLRPRLQRGAGRQGDQGPAGQGADPDQVRHAVGRRARVRPVEDAEQPGRADHRHPQQQAGQHRARGRAEPPPAAGRRDRFVPDPLARPDDTDRRVGRGDGEDPEGRQGAGDRRQQLQREATRGGRPVAEGERVDAGQPAAAVQRDQPGDREGGAALLPADERRDGRLLADGARAADREVRPRAQVPARRPPGELQGVQARGPQGRPGRAGAGEADRGQAPGELRAADRELDVQRAGGHGRAGRRAERRAGRAQRRRDAVRADRGRAAAGPRRVQRGGGVDGV
ncbi:MAG: hypothetical protein AVDCRST_MAG64-1244, partial [uncultured Phycisphaerae bacterium]